MCMCVCIYIYIYIYVNTQILDVFLFASEGYEMSKFTKFQFTIQGSMRLGALPTLSEGQDFSPGGSSPLWILAIIALP